MKHNRTNFFWGYYLVFLCGLFLVSSGRVNAASVYFGANSNLISPEDTAVIGVYLDTEQKNINVVEGELEIQSGNTDIEIRGLSIAGSDFSFWSRKPSWSEETHMISFVGGQPGGVIKKDALLFNIILKGLESGDVIFSPTSLIAYTHDGQGTPLSVRSENFLLRVEGSIPAQPSDEWRTIVSQDNTPPEVLSASVGSDLSLFDGKLFITIESSDTESGIDYFEVHEGDFPSVRTGHEYVLQNQKGTSAIVITAYDKAGNSRVFEFTPVSSYGYVWVFGVVIAFVGIIIYIVIVQRKKRSHKEFV